MNLQDTLREQTGAIVDLLNGIENEIAQHRRRQASAEQRERRLKQEAAEMQPAISERQKTLRDLQLKVQELERQLAELQERLEERQKEHERAETDSRALQEESTDKLKDASRVRKEAESWGRKLSEAQERLHGYQTRLREERRAAFRKYLTGLWTKLLESELKAEGGKQALAALEHLNRARHEEPTVAELWEARQEWQRIAQSAGPPPVRKTATRELQKIEAELDRQFPGALKAADSGTLDELEEVFYYPWPSGNRHLLPLPVPAELCESLDAGSRGPAEHLAARIIWAFARGLSKDTGEGESQSPRFEIQQSVLVMFVDEGLEKIKAHDTIALPVAGGGRISFMLSELSQDVSGAMSDESTYC